MTVLLGALLGASAPAQARTYGGSFTPPFGGDFPDLEWSGSGKFYIPDACEAQSTGWYANSGPTCGGMTISDGQLVFTSIGSSTTTDVFNFGSAPVVNMYVDGGGLHGVESTFIGGFTSSTYNMVGSTPVWFWLKFEHEIAVGPNLSVVQLYFNAVGEGPDCIVRGNCSVFGASENKAILILTPVPEPASYAMMLAGLAGLGFFVRRRQQR
ncbi:MAG TPA: PEP-CTERM sorting domain-containing protein [Burkholderiaceae bacterium]|nr:PEP-CTERM sorting domain-containing protein [Burkholderiaceae bacterium]